MYYILCKFRNYNSIYFVKLLPKQSLAFDKLNHFFDDHRGVCLFWRSWRGWMHTTTQRKKKVNILSQDNVKCFNNLIFIDLDITFPWIFFTNKQIIFQRDPVKYIFHIETAQMLSMFGSKHSYMYAVPILILTMSISIKMTKTVIFIHSK